LPGPGAAYQSPDQPAYLYLPEQGWWYLVGTPDNLWAWDSQMGWLWFQPAWYGHLYDKTTESWWLYSYSDDQGLRVFANDVSGDYFIPQVLDTGVDQSAQPIHQPTPKYPIELRKKGITGTVVLTFIIERSGRLSEIAVASSDHPAFTEACLKAVKFWWFQPMIRDGVAVRARYRQPIPFTLNISPLKRQPIGDEDEAAAEGQVHGPELIGVVDAGPGGD
jgi:TonB family protein